MDASARSSEEQQSPIAAEAPQIFISYAREDVAFVERLALRLADADRTTYFDLRGIPVWAPDWQAELYDAIERADDFLIVLSPDSLASPNVALELRHAVAQGKRIKPLQIRDVDQAQVDPSVGTPQWIDFRDDRAFDKRFSDLLEFLDTDVDWVRKHTRFGLLANEWKRRNEDPSLVLGRSDLREAEAWLAQRGEKEPPPTDLQEQFVAASRAQAVRRRRIILSASGLVLAVSLALGLFALVQYRSAGSSADAARSRQIAASAVAALATDPGEALRLAIRAAKTAPTAQAKSALRQALSESFAQAVLQGRSDALSDARFSPDGKLVGTRSLDGTVRIWDPRAARLVAAVKRPTPIDAYAFTPDGKRLVTLTGVVEVWDATTGKHLKKLPLEVRDRHFVAFSPAADLVASSDFIGTLSVWSTTTNVPLFTHRAHRDTIRDVAFTNDGRFVASASADGTARVWETASGRELALLEHGDGLNTVTFSPDAARVLTAGADGTARVFNAATGKELLVLRGHTAAVSSAAFSPNGALIVTVSLDNTARIWDATTGAEISQLRGHDDTVWQGDFSRDGRLVATASADATARVWDTATGLQLAVLRGHTGNVSAARFGPDGRSVVTAGSDGSARIWGVSHGDRVSAVAGEPGPGNVVAFHPGGHLVLSTHGAKARIWRTTGKAVRTISAAARWLNSAEFDRSGRYVVTAGAYGRIQLWNAATGRELASVEAYPGMGNLARFSPDGTLVVTTNLATAARVLRVPSGEEVASLGESCRPTAAAFSPDSTDVVTTCVDRTARVWAATGGSPRTTLRGHTDVVDAVAFSPGGERVVTGSSDRTARVWDAGTGENEAVLRGHGDPLTAVAFSPDGRLIVTASLDETARLWRADGESISVLRGHRASVTHAAFSPDGEYVVTSGGDGTVRVWEAETGDSVAVFRGHIRTVNRAVFGPSGKYIASAGVDRTARVFFCWLCRPIDQLVELGERSLPRTTTASD